jgi:hypothetical protein
MNKQMKPTLTLLAPRNDSMNENLSRDNNTPGRAGSLYRACDKPELVIDVGNLPAAAREVRDALASHGSVFARGVPVKVVRSAEGGPPTAIPLTAEQVVLETHLLCQPVGLGRDGKLVPKMLPTRVARMYLAMLDEWKLQPLAGICTAPLLASDGSVRAAEGYDRSTGLWCANVPALQIPERPTRADAEAALRRLRKMFRTFPFADAVRIMDFKLSAEVVDLDRAPGGDESAFLVGLLTAVCRPHLPLAPGLLIRAPEISGSGTGKGLLARSICAIAFGVGPQPLRATAGS